ncbi:MAG TPA: NAD-dependent epimerase/dehydratase family protein [Kiritimatiellia bacterium]|jgi:UDP-glucose 4-epimerase|nr:NAD-dependent epimerase/dehydratase family protein [Kiritimatiellia bacterium]
MERLLGDKIERVFLTGGSGFIGSHVADMLMEQGYAVTVYDNLSNGRREFIEHHFGKPGFAFHEADILDMDKLSAAMAGHDLVWHLAANTDIIGGVEQPRRDLRDCVMGTFNVLEAMRATRIQPVIFSSTGAVYGDLCFDVATSEASGPLLPVSTYAAGKIGSEAFISSFCHLYGLRAWMFRFGNVIGARMTHGVIYDFIHKLRANPQSLLIRGAGNQEKNYFLVEECIDGMAYAFRNIPMTEDKPCDLFNLGTDSITRVTDIAEIVKTEMGLEDAEIKIEGTKQAWPGDQPRVHITVDKMRALGWTARRTSDQAVAAAVRRMLGK